MGDSGDIRTIADLTQDPRNARRHTARGVGMIEDALNEVGAARSIVIDERGVILAGNATVEAAANAGIERVKVVDADGEELVAVRRSGLSESAKKRLALFDNRTGELSDWSGEMLADLQREDEALLAGLFRDHELEEILGDLMGEATEDPGAQIDRAAELQEKWQVERGQIWEIGRHRLMCGDSTNAEDVGRLMNGERAALCLTDPPYGIGASEMTMGSAQSSKPKEARLSHNQSWDGERIDLLPLLNISNWVCIWGGNYYADMLPVTNDWLCWHKKNDGLSFSEFELAWTNYGKQARHFAHHWGGETKEHITQKPLAVVVWAIETCPDKARSVYDPFLGSGTTLAACEQTGRIGYGMEIEPKYCAVSLERLTGMGLEAQPV